MDTTSLWLPARTVGRWMLKEDRIRIDSAGLGPSHGDDRPRTQNETLIEVYEKMEREGKKGEGKVRTAAVFAPLKQATLPTFRQLWQAFLLLMHPLRMVRREDPLAWKAVSHTNPTRDALSFRSRR